jgi:hypothetical protein
LSYLYANLYPDTSKITQTKKESVYQNRWDECYSKSIHQRMMMPSIRLAQRKAAASVPVQLMMKKPDDAAVDRVQRSFRSSFPDAKNNLRNCGKSTNEIEI